MFDLENKVIEMWNGTATAGGFAPDTDVKYNIVTSKFKSGVFTLNLTAVSGTTPVLDCAVFGYDEISNNWAPLGWFAQQTALDPSGLATSIAINNLPNKIAVAWAIDGTTPSFTWTVGACLKTK